MRQISIKEAKSDMVLHAPAIDQQGRVLLAKGEILTDMLIQRFINYGVSQLHIEGGESEELDDLQQNIDLQDNISENDPSHDTAKIISEDLDKRFVTHKNNTFMQKIRLLAEKHLLQQHKNNLSD